MKQKNDLKEGNKMTISNHDKKSDKSEKNQKERGILSNFTICTSNLEEFKRDEIKVLIESLGGKFSQNLKKCSNLIISNKINTEKCLFAKRANIPIVTIDWLRDCQKLKKLQNFSEYNLKCLQGATMALLGYNNFEAEGLKKLIKKFKGEIEDTLEDCDVILVKSSTALDFGDVIKLQPYTHKAVYDLWIHKCIEKSEFIPLNYYKYENDFFRQAFEKIEKEYLELEQILYEGIEGKKLKKKLINLKLHNKYDKSDSDDPYYEVRKQLLIFSEFIFFLADDLNKITKEYMTKAISLAKGVIFNKITPITTHIICNTDKNNFTNYTLFFGSFYNPIIVNPNWVLDSLDKKDLLPIESYRPILENLEIEKNVNKDEIIINSITISSIFSEYYFYIYPDSYSKEEIFLTKEKIRQNSGYVIMDESLDEIKPNYIIVNDGFSSQEMANIISKRIDNYQYIVSHRFIDFCIEKRKLIDFSKEKYYHLVPFPQTVPFENFSEVVAYFHAYTLSDSSILEYLVETLGGKCELSNLTTHIFVEDKIDDKKIHYFRNKYSQDIRFIRIEWLLECMVEGRKVKEERFLIENSV